MSAGKHKLRDKTVKGIKMKRCSRCKAQCPADQEEMLANTKCPGRAK